MPWSPDFTKDNPWEGMPTDYAGIATFIPTQSNPRPPWEGQTGAENIPPYESREYEEAARQITQNYAFKTETAQSIEEKQRAKDILAASLKAEQQRRLPAPSSVSEQVTISHPSQALVSKIQADIKRQSPTEQNIKAIQKVKQQRTAEIALRNIVSDVSTQKQPEFKELYVSSDEAKAILAQQEQDNIELGRSYIPIYGTVHFADKVPGWQTALSAVGDALLVYSLFSAPIKSVVGSVLKIAPSKEATIVSTLKPKASFEGMPPELVTTERAVNDANLKYALNLKNGEDAKLRLASNENDLARLTVERNKNAQLLKEAEAVTDPNQRYVMDVERRGIDALKEKLSANDKSIKRLTNEQAKNADSLSQAEADAQVSRQDLINVGNDHIDQWETSAKVAKEDIAKIKVGRPEEIPETLRMIKASDLSTRMADDTQSLVKQLYESPKSSQDILRDIGEAKTRLDTLKEKYPASPDKWVDASQEVQRLGNQYSASKLDDLMKLDKKRIAANEEVSRLKLLKTTEYVDAKAEVTRLEKLKATVKEQEANARIEKALQEARLKADPASIAETLQKELQKAKLAKLKADTEFAQALASTERIELKAPPGGGGGGTATATRVRHPDITTVGGGTKVSTEKIVTAGLVDIVSTKLAPITKAKTKEIVTPKPEQAPIIKTTIITKPKTTTTPSIKTESTPGYKPFEITKPATMPATTTKTTTSTEVKTSAKAKISTRAEPVPKTEPATKLTTGTNTTKKITTSIKPVLKRGIPNIVIKKVKGAPSSMAKAGTVSWRQGRYWITINPPYKKGKDSVSYDTKPPVDAPRLLKTPQDTLFKRKQVPREIDLGMGVVRSEIKNGKRINFYRQHIKL